MSYVSLGQTMMATGTPQTPCVTAAEKEKALADCRIPDVKGLGRIGLGFTYGTNTRFNGIDACKVAQMPICPTLARTTMSVAPLPTSKTMSKPRPPPPVAIATISPTTIAAIQAGTTCPPGMIKMSGGGCVSPSAVAPQIAPDPEKKLNVAVVGLLAVVALGGGYLVYKKMKKPAPAKMAENRRRRQRRNSGMEPRPKFKVGDRVKDKEVSRTGVVVHVHSYDDVIGGYRYKVQEADGTRLYWNEPTMLLVRRP